MRHWIQCEQHPEREVKRNVKEEVVRRKVWLEKKWREKEFLFRMFFFSVTFLWSEIILSPPIFYAFLYQSITTRIKAIINIKNIVKKKKIVKKYYKN